MNMLVAEEERNIRQRPNGRMIVILEDVAQRDRLQDVEYGAPISEDREGNAFCWLLENACYLDLIGGLMRSSVAFL